MAVKGSRTMSKHLSVLLDEAVDETSASAEVSDYLLHTEEDMMQHEYSWRIGEDDIDYEDEEIRADYEKFVRGRAEERVEAAINELAWLEVTDGRMHVWRSITVPTGWIQTGIAEQPVGVCWAYTEDAAEAHYGNFSQDLREVTLHGLVAIEDIDWQASVILNGQSEEEREIRIKDDAMVEVLSATWSPAARGGAFSTEEIGLVLPAGKTAFARTVQAAPEFA
jgi:hypothetical protein